MCHEARSGPLLGPMLAPTPGARSQYSHVNSSLVIMNTSPLESGVIPSADQVVRVVLPGPPAC